MNYGAFKTMVAAYLHRADQTSNIPNFIDFGRIRLSNLLRVPEMETTDTVTITSNEGTLPDDLVAIRSVKASDYELRQVALEEIPIYDQPYVYAVRGFTLIVPGGSSVTVTYYAAPLTFIGDALGDSATRVILDAYPSIWLQAALVEGFRFLDDVENEQKASERFMAEITAANAAAHRVRYGPAGFVSAPAWNDFSVSSR